MNIVFKLEGDLAALQSKKRTLMAAIEERVGILSQQLYETVQAKLSGGVLNVGTGALLSSVILSAVAVTGLQVSSFVEIPDDSPQHLIGCVHEFGGNGYYIIEPVNAQALRFIVGGSVVFAKHVNHPPAIQRSFMQSSLDEMTETIYAELESAINEVLAA